MQLTKAQVEGLIDKYPIGHLVNFERIKEQGFMNYMFVVKTNKGQFILRIAKNTKEKKDLLFEINLLNLLKGIPVPKYVKDKKGQYINRFKENNYSLYKYLEGKMPKKITKNLLKEMAYFLAKFHRQTKNFDITQQRFAWYNFTNERADEFEQYMIKKLVGYKDEISYLKSEVLNNRLPEKIPTGPIHVDMRRQNILAIGNKLTGVVDFDNCQMGPYILDLSMSIIWVCTKKDGLDYKKTYEFLKHYEKFRKLNKIEKENFFQAIRYAYASQVFVNHYVYAKKLVTKEHFQFGRKHFLSALRNLNYKKFSKYVESPIAFLYRLF